MSAVIPVSTIRPTSNSRRAPGGGVRLWYIVAIGLAGFAILSLVRSVREAPARQLRAELGGVGTVLVTLRLSPDPPKVGPVPMRVEVTDTRGIGVAVDGKGTLLSSATGPASDIAIRSTAQGAFEGTVFFPAVGAWWLDIELASGQAETRVRFPVRVVANI